MTFRPRAGATIDGRFRLHEQIASGGFATVWRATDEREGMAVAVKCGRDETHDRKTVRERFRSELKCFRRLDGAVVPGALVQFVDGTVEAGDETAYVVTELVHGESLDSLASPGLDAAAAVGRPLCAALAFCHRCGVTYLDLKPNNVLRRRRGPPALVDFNAAIVDDDAPPVFHQDGFKPPEVTPPKDDRPAGPHSDVYALGALLVYLLTGLTNPAEAADGDPVDPVAFGADPPAAVAEVLRTATAPDPADRYADAGELSAALAPHLDGFGRSARLAAPGGERDVRVHPGATLGRWTTDGPVPSVVLADPRGHLSAQHVALSYRRDAWYLQDHSLNGTFVATGRGLAYVVSADGLARQREAGRRPPHPDPAEVIRLADGDRIVPVDPDYGVEVQFRVD